VSTKKTRETKEKKPAPAKKGAGAVPPLVFTIGGPTRLSEMPEDPFNAKLFATLAEVTKALKKQARAVSIEKLASALLSIESSDVSSTQFLAGTIRLELASLLGEPQEAEKTAPAPAPEITSGVTDLE